MTTPNPKPRPLHLLDARAYPAVASRSGIREPEMALVLAGRLLRLQVGRRTYYRWVDLLAVMPEWARRENAPLSGATYVPAGAR